MTQTFSSAAKGALFLVLFLFFFQLFFSSALPSFAADSGSAPAPRYFFYTHWPELGISQGDIGSVAADPPPSPALASEMLRGIGKWLTYVFIGLIIVILLALSYIIYRHQRLKRHITSYRR